MQSEILKLHFQSLIIIPYNLLNAIDYDDSDATLLE